jgi:RHS repeat-associated protein
LASTTDASGTTTSFEYDTNNRRTKVIYADGTTSQAAYDALGRKISTTDQAGKTTHYEYDSLNRLTRTKDALNNQTTFAYDEAGRMISQTDANGHVTKFEYDLMGRVIKRTLPEGNSETVTHNIAGQITSRTDSNGKTTTYTYDTMGRLLTKTPDSSFAQAPVTYTYTPSGQRASMVDASGTTTYSYDNRHRLLTKASPQGTLTYSYDEVGNLVSIRSSNANGTSVDYAYDQLNRLATVTDVRAGNATTTYGYDPVGNLRSYVQANGARSDYTYNSLNRLTGMTVKNTLAMTIASYSYVLGPAGNRLSATELNGRHVAYTYDDVYRLTDETITNDPSGTTNGAISYVYDGVGNRTSRSSTLASVPSASYQYDANNRPTNDSYDANGNLIARQGNSYRYDFEDHLAQMNNGAVQMTYDGDGKLVSRTVAGVTSTYLVSDVNPTGHSQVLEEISNGSAKRVYTYGLTLLNQSQLLGGVWQWSFYGLDGHGSVRFLTDGAGAITDTYDYDAFGNLIAVSGSTPNERLYAGEQYDPNAGFYYLRARFYDQSSGRFVTADKFAGSPYDPASLHRYVYAQNDPVNRIDPSGYWSTADTFATVTMLGILAASAISMLTLHALTYYYLPKEHFNRWPDAAVGGIQVNFNITKIIVQRASYSIWADALAAAFMFTTASVGAEVMLPRGTPEIWGFGFAGPTFSVDSDMLADTWDPLGQVTFNPYFGGAWNVHSPGDYSGWFFCSQASKQIIKSAIIHMDFSWFHDRGQNWRDPLTLSASLCVSPKDNPNTAYSLTFGRDTIFNNPSWRLGTAAYYYFYVGGLSYAPRN